MRAIITAAAALALAAGAAHAQGNGNGSDRGGDRGDRHAGGDRASGGGDDKGRGADANRRGDDDSRGGSPRMQGGGNKDRSNASGPGNGGGSARAEQGNSGERGNGARRAAARDGGRDFVAGDVVRVRDFAALPARGLVAGCPPGLARKSPACVPPGQVRSPFRVLDRPGFWGLRLDDGRYRYDDGYLVRLGPDGRIGGYVPLLGGALAIGRTWPTYYQRVALPAYDESYYGLGPDDSYRYADNVIYRIDPETAAITSIAALLTGDDFAVGSPMPTGYDVYNVPYAHRAQYRDTADALYRYSDGHVYQVDPETRLVAAVIELLAS